MSINYNLLEKRIKEFRNYSEVDDITIASVILEVIQYSLGYETLESITYTAVRETIGRKLEEKFNEAIRFIKDTNLNGLPDDYWKYVFNGENTPVDYYLIKDILPFEPNRFILAISNVRKGGIPVYVTNFNRFEPQVWEEYERPLLKKESNSKKYNNIIQGSL